MDNLKLKDVVCNRNFDINCRYRIYLGVWNDDGELLWDSDADGGLYEDNGIINLNVMYITVHDNVLIIEVG